MDEHPFLCAIVLKEGNLVASLNSEAVLNWSFKQKGILSHREEDSVRKKEFTWADAP